MGGVGLCRRGAAGGRIHPHGRPPAPATAARKHGLSVWPGVPWPAAPPTATTMLESPWVASHRGLYLVRCGLGSGASVSFEVEVRRGTGGTPGPLYTGTTTIPRSWHRHDHRVLYFITGTLANGDIDGGQMFPTNASMTPHPTLTDRLNYFSAAKAWQNVPMGGVTLDRLLSGSSPDVVISGYWDPGPGIKDRCTGSVACVFPAGTYPHLGNGQVFVIEDPPRWPKGCRKRKWTTEFLMAADQEGNGRILAPGLDARVRAHAGLGPQRGQRRHHGWPCEPQPRRHGRAGPAGHLCAPPRRSLGDLRCRPWSTCSSGAPGGSSARPWACCWPRPPPAGRASRLSRCSPPRTFSGRRTPRGGSRRRWSSRSSTRRRSCGRRCSRRRRRWRRCPAIPAWRPPTRRCRNCASRCTST